MKKIIFGLIATFGISIVTFGQATLENSYQTTEWQYEQTNAFKTDAGLNYFTLNNVTNTLLIYNSSHSLIKTVVIPISSGFTLKYIYGLTDKLFNTDSLIEFIIFSQGVYDPATGTQNKMTLVNENGAILQQFGNKSEAYVIKGIGGAYKLITLSNPYNAVPTATNFDYDVYSLPGTSLGTVLLNRNSNSLVAYPNPTENRIAITNNLNNGENGILEVFDVNGKKLIQKNIIGEENGEINLDTTELSSGVYIYKLNGQTNRFIKK